MGYNKEDLYNQAIGLIKDKNLFFIEDVVGFMSCTKSTFYAHFPIDSVEMNTIKEELENNRISIKTNMRKKWYDSDNATLQIALMKLISTDEERKRISNTYIDKTDMNVSGDGMKFTITREIIDNNDSNE